MDPRKNFMLHELSPFIILTSSQGDEVQDRLTCPNAGLERGAEPRPHHALIAELSPECPPSVRKTS